MFLERSQTLPWGRRSKKRRKSETHIAKAERRRERDWKEGRKGYKSPRTRVGCLLGDSVFYR